MSASRLVLNEPSELRFEINRAALVDAEIFAAERSRIFERCWLYVGHESEVRAPGDFRTRTVCGRPLLFCRDGENRLRVFLNSCRHRGTVVCREPAGNAQRYTCFYHGWTYDRDGRLYAVPGQSAYPPNFDRSQYGLKEPPRVEEYRGFVFLNFDANATALGDYLGKATEYIDLVLDQSPSGRMEVIHGTQEYDIRANWKLLVENSFDDYHLLTTHSTWLDYLKSSGVEVKRPEKGHLLPSHGLGKDLGNGHGTTDNVNFRGRPVAAWIPIYGDAAKSELERIRSEITRRVGEQRARRVCDTNRNLLIFPNLVLLDGSSVSVRSFQPVAPDRMRVRAWALGPVEETPLARQVRLDSFLTFYGPGGFATPDDIAALESVQEGLGTYKEVQWSPLTRGIAKQGEQLNTDEAHLRAFWVQWDKLMRAA
jgi:phenylpropionate dioxygenase-like ring-hydroxylating dioxygenase large terminal subunit